MDILILCNQNDAVAIALYGQLTNSGEKVYLITAEELIYAASWNHEINEKGKGTTEIILQNGYIIRSAELKSAWNRIRYFPMTHFKNETDRYYAQSEMFALYFSFLKSINDVLANPVHTYDLVFEEDNTWYQKKQAIDAGLAVCDYHFTSSPKWRSSPNLIPVMVNKKPGSLFQKTAPYLVWQNLPVLYKEANPGISKAWIAGKEIIAGKLPVEKAALRKLSKNLNKPFLEIDFANTPSGIKVSCINTFPLAAPSLVINSLASLLIQKKIKTR